MSDKPLTDAELLAVEVWACGNVVHESTLVLRLLSDLEAARASSATYFDAAESAARYVRLAEGERDEMREARDDATAVRDRLKNTNAALRAELVVAHGDLAEMREARNRIAAEADRPRARLVDIEGRINQCVARPITTCTRRRHARFPRRVLPADGGARVGDGYCTRVAAMIDSRTIPTPWVALFHEINGGRIPDGEPGIRDVDAPCEAFQLGEPRGGTCETDGHYICAECVEISPKVLRRRRDLCEECGTPLKFRSATDHEGACASGCDDPPSRTPVLT